MAPPMGVGIAAQWLACGGVSMLFACLGVYYLDAMFVTILGAFLGAFFTIMCVGVMYDGRAMFFALFCGIAMYVAAIIPLHVVPEMGEAARRARADLARWPEQRFLSCWEAAYESSPLSLDAAAAYYVLSDKHWRVDTARASVDDVDYGWYRLSAPVEYTGKDYPTCGFGNVTVRATCILKQPPASAANLTAACGWDYPADDPRYVLAMRKVAAVHYYTKAERTHFAPKAKPGTVYVEFNSPSMWDVEDEVAGTLSTAERARIVCPACAALYVILTALAWAVLYVACAPSIDKGAPSSREVRAAPTPPRSDDGGAAAPGRAYADPEVPVVAACAAAPNGECP